VDALASIQNEWVGIDPNELKAAAKVQKAMLNSMGTAPTTVEVTAERQYLIWSIRR